MRQFSVKVLDDADREFVEVLRELGIPRNVASMITYLANVEEATSREIEIGSNLHPAVVSQSAHGYAHLGLAEVGSDLNLP